MCTGRGSGGMGKAAGSGWGSCRKPSSQERRAGPRAHLWGTVPFSVTASHHTLKPTLTMVLAMKTRQTTKALTSRFRKAWRKELQRGWEGRSPRHPRLHSTPAGQAAAGRQPPTRGFPAGEWAPDDGVGPSGATRGCFPSGSVPHPTGPRAGQSCPAHPPKARDWGPSYSRVTATIQTQGRLVPKHQNQHPC